MRKVPRSWLATTMYLVCWSVMCATANGQAVTLLRDFNQSRGFGGVSGFVLDGSNVYVAGRFFAAPFHAFLGKYGTDGQEQWLRPFLIPGGVYPPLAELSGGLAITPSGVYMTAAGRTARGDSNIFLRKFTSDGAVLWTREFDVPTQDSPGEVATDDTGVYVTGRAGTVAMVWKYDFDGGEQWARSVLSDLPNGTPNVAADSSGVYVAMNAVIRKYDASGNEVWSRQLAEKTFVADVMLYGDVVFVVGTQTNAFAGTNRTVSFLSTYTPSGNPIWERHFGPDTAAAVAVDYTGIYVGGVTYSAVRGNCQYGEYDAVLRKFHADGAESWARQFSFTGWDYVRSLAVTDFGVYVAGNVFARIDKDPQTLDPSKPQILNGCVVNAASLVGGGVAPGEMVTIMGSGLGPLVPTVHRETAGGLPTRLSETSVFFDGIAAPLISVSSNQSTVIVPYEIAGRSSVSVEVEFQGTRSNVAVLPVFPAKPGIFTRDGSGLGQAEAFNEDGTPNSATNPAPRRSIITFYATGEGLIDPPVATGSFIGTSTHRPQLDVNVGFEAGCEGVLGELISAVEKTESPAGLLEVRARVPEWANLGDAIAFSMSLETPLAQGRGFSAGSSGTSVAISETRIATDLVIAPSGGVSRGVSFTATVSGPNFNNETYLDVRYRRPNSRTEEIALNWQIGISGTHTIPLDTEPGTWTITGIRAHSNMNDRSGEFLPASAVLEVVAPN